MSPHLRTGLVVVGIVVLSAASGAAGGFALATMHPIPGPAGAVGPPGLPGPAGPEGPEGPAGHDAPVVASQPTAPTVSRDPMTQCTSDPAVRSTAQTASVAVTGRSVTAAALRELCAEGLLSATSMKYWFTQQDIAGTLPKYGY